MPSMQPQEISPPALPARSSSDDFWLDLLPVGVCEIISRFAVKLEYQTAALCLAESSPSQRSAVAAALKFEYPILGKDRGLCDGPRWAAVFDSCVRLVATRCYIADEVYLPLLQCPSLCSATVQEKPAFLRALCSASYLGELTVYVGDCSHDALVDTLSKLKITKLSLTFNYYGSPNATFPEICAAVGNNFLGVHCPQLEYLEIDCMNCDSETLIEAVEGLHALRELSIWPRKFRASDRELVATLRKIERVNLEMVEGLDLALAIGAPVVQVATDELRFPEDLLLQLPHLEKLRIGLDTSFGSGKYDELATALAQLPHLHALHIDWKSPDFGPDDTDTAADESSSNVLKLVNILPNLKDLTLDGNVYGNVSDNELMAILRKLGSRLKRLNTTLRLDRFDYGMPHERLLRILKTIAAHNHGLEYAVIMSLTSTIQWENETPVPLEVRRERRARLTWAQELINRHVPDLDASFVNLTADLVCRIEA